MVKKNPYDKTFYDRLLGGLYAFFKSVVLLAFIISIINHTNYAKNSHNWQHAIFVIFISKYAPIWTPNNLKGGIQIKGNKADNLTKIQDTRAYNTSNAIKNGNLEFKLTHVPTN
jgi:hypothetical protein